MQAIALAAYLESETLGSKVLVILAGSSAAVALASTP